MVQKQEIAPIPLYTPYRCGKFKTSPDFVPLGTDLGAGRLDQLLIQWDEDAATIQQAKAVVRSRRQTWFPTPVLDSRTASEVANLLAEHASNSVPNFHDALGMSPNERIDVIGQQIPEDFAITLRTDDGADRIAALHVSLPSRWDPAEKQQLDFAATHAPVPSMQRVSRVSGALMDSVRSKGPQVRFTWGIAFDPGYDQHPGLPKAVFNGHDAWVRIERQVLWPMEWSTAFLFTIRLHVHPIAALAADPNAAAGLALALRAMTPDEKEYKGLADSAEAVADRLDQIASGPQ